MDTNKLHDLKQWTYPEDLVAKYPVLTISAIQYHMRERDSNGLARAVCRIGRKLALHEPTYIAWLTDPDRKTA